MRAAASREKFASAFPRRNVPRRPTNVVTPASTKASCAWCGSSLQNPVRHDWYVHARKTAPPTSASVNTARIVRLREKSHRSLHTACPPKQYGRPEDPGAAFSRRSPPGATTYCGPAIRGRSPRRTRRRSLCCGSKRAAARKCCPRRKKALRRIAEGRLSMELGATGFEPATSWTQTTRSSQSELRPGRGGAIVRAAGEGRNRKAGRRVRAPRPATRIAGPHPLPGGDAGNPRRPARPVGEGRRCPARPVGLGWSSGPEPTPRAAGRAWLCPALPLGLGRGERLGWRSGAGGGLARASHPSPQRMVRAPPANA